jgi:hypothetical protein
MLSIIYSAYPSRNTFASRQPRADGAAPAEAHRPLAALKRAKNR